MQRRDSAMTWARSALFVVMLVLLGAACSQSPSGSEGFTTSTTLPVLEPSVTVSVVSTSTSTTDAPSTSTTETTEPTGIGDTSEVSSRFRGLPSTPLWKFAEHLAIAMDGIDGRDGVGPGETTDFVEEAALVYRRSESRELYDVWLFFNPPDEGSTFFSGEPLIEVATEDSVVGPVVVYKARAGSESIAPAAARVLVCDDTVQLWVLGEFPRETRDEVVAVAGFVDCTSMDS